MPEKRWLEEEMSLLYIPAIINIQFSLENSKTNLSSVVKPLNLLRNFNTATEDWIAFLQWSSFIFLFLPFNSLGIFESYGSLVDHNLVITNEYEAGKTILQ